MMGVKDDVRTQLEDLRRQLARLEQATRQCERGGRWRWWPLVAAFVLGSVVAGRFWPGPATAWAQQDEKPAAQEIVCKAIKVVDTEGKERVRVGFDERGGL